MGRLISLLTLPLEIRMLIYEAVLEPDRFDFVDSAYILTDQRHSLMRRIEGFNIVTPRCHLKSFNLLVRKSRSKATTSSRAVW